ncbi:MAG: hypothetical protein ACKO96_24115 [Flammeovirgaceae bacterium]
MQALFACASVWPSPRREKKYQTRPSAKGVTKTFVGSGKKIKHRWRCAKANTFIFSTEVCLCAWPCNFTAAHKSFWRVPFARGHRQKVLAHRFYLVAGRRLPCTCGGCIRARVSRGRVIPSTGGVR